MVKAERMRACQAPSEWDKSLATPLHHCDDLFRDRHRLHRPCRHVQFTDRHRADRGLSVFGGEQQKLDQAGQRSGDEPEGRSEKRPVGEADVCVAAMSHESAVVRCARAPVRERRLKAG